MAAPSDYLDVADLKAIAAGGIVREDVADQIFDISEIPTPFLDMIPETTYSNSYHEWTEDKLNAPDLANAAVSGKDIASTDNKAGSNGVRKGNHAQICTKPIMVTERGQAVGGIGRADEMGYQTAMRLNELRRDVEAIVLSGQASVQDDNNATAGKAGGVPAWMFTNKDLGATGAIAGFQTGTKLVTAQTNGTARAGTFTMISTQIENVYNLGGNPTVLMSMPAVTKRLAQFLITTPNSAKPTANVMGEHADRSMNGGVAQITQMYVDAFKTDFGTFMSIVPNRLMQVQTGTQANVLGLDPRFWALALLYGWAVKPLADIGLSHRKLLHVDWTLEARLERSSFVIADITTTAAWTA